MPWTSGSRYWSASRATPSCRPTGWRALWACSAPARPAKTRAALDAVLGTEPPADDRRPDLAPRPPGWARTTRPARRSTLDTGPLDADRVNAWSNEKTHGMIPRIVDSLHRRRGARDHRRRVPGREVGAAVHGHPPGAVRGRRRGADDASSTGASSTPTPRSGCPTATASCASWRCSASGASRRGGAARASSSCRASATTSSLELADPLIELGLGPAFEPGQDFEQLITGPGEKA